MTVVLIIGFFMSLFLIVLLAGKKNKMPADKVLVGMLTIYALTIGGTYIEVYNQANNYPYPHLMNFSWLFLLLHGPLLWFYIKYLTSGNFRIKSIHLLHFTPFIVYSIVHYFNFLHLSANEKIYLATQINNTTLAAKIGGIIIGLSTIGYNLAALFLLKKHRKNIQNRFSNIENIDLNWLRTLAIASLVIFSLNVFLFNLNNYLHFIEYYKLSLIAYSFSSAYVLYVGYFGIKQGRIFVDNPNIPDEQNNNAKKDLPKPTDRKDFTEMISKLSGLMEQQQPHLDPELTLSKLSARLKVKPEALSEVLNGYLDQNFFDYVNKYRIEDFKIRYMDKSNSHLSIIGLAYECGFNSKAAFYRAFNKFEGMSPTAWSAKVS